MSTGRKIVKNPIISCSRRTDIPAFLMDWVLERIKIGYVDVENPFNKNQVSRVSLKPNDVRCWVWWSKDFSSWIKSYNAYPEVFKQYKGHYFQFTINSPSELESNLKTTLHDRLKQLKWLTQEFGPQAISYRFDPIILYKRDDSEKIYSNLNKFEHIIHKVAHNGIKEMIFSFATLYSKVINRMKRRDKIALPISFEKKVKILDKLKSICDKYEIQMKACCQPDLLTIEGIEQAHCIDAYKIENLTGGFIPKKKDTGQREACGCFKSKDIGGYTGIFRCKHNCDYCYASPSRK
ncbi:MAG: DUF1848 family protein [Candidatus Lokiarchaeota archaeon]|nr:DUF1848 family protein [Candidatus Lokiarchaeota archaeon]MBD3339959.1 DUF1848 family protein [Candidatus Lokiarchaeota archaeon]